MAPESARIPEAKSAPGQARIPNRRRRRFESVLTPCPLNKISFSNRRITVLFSRPELAPEPIRAGGSALPL